MDKEVATIINNIKQKTIALKKANASLQQENNLLKQQQQDAAKEYAAHQLQIKAMQHQIQALQLLQVNMDATEKKGLTKEIEKHITTINKSITLLSE